MDVMQLSVVRTLQCLVKGEALVSLCPGHAAMLVEGQAVQTLWQSWHGKHSEVWATRRVRHGQLFPCQALL